MTKTTKRPLPVSKTIQFQQHQKIKDISVSGKDALTSVDFSERDGDFKLKVKADPDKVNELSGTPFVTTSVTTADEGTDDPKKSVALGHDYRGLNLETAGKYLSINKTKDKAVIDGTLIEADLTKALNDAKEAKEKADKAAEKAGLADQKATTAITQIASVSDASSKLTEASKTADAKLQAEIDKLKAKLETLPKEAKLYVSEADKERANGGRLEGLTYVDFYTALDSTDATALSVSENVTISVTLKQDTDATNGTAFTREVAEIRLEVAKPVVKDWTEEWQTLTVNVETAQSYAMMAKTKAEEADTKAEKANAKLSKLNFTPITPVKALFAVSQARGHSAFTQEHVDRDVLSSHGLLVDMGDYWLPVGSVSIGVGNEEADPRELLDFDVYVYNVNTAQVEPVRANTLLTINAIPPILKSF